MKTQSIRKRLSQEKTSILLKLFAVFLVLSISACTSMPNKKTTLLLEEIEREQQIRNEVVDGDSMWVPAKIEKRWVPDQYRGNRIYVPGHYEFVVVNPGYWKKNNDKNHAQR